MRTVEERLEIVRKIAKNLLRKHHLQPPVDVFDLAAKERLHIQYEGNPVGVDAGKGLVQKSNEIVLHRRLGLAIQATLPVHGFQLVANCVQRTLTADYFPAKHRIAR